MRISIASDHRYPANINGRASCRRTDLLARGLAELGHEVYYHLVYGAFMPLPEGVMPVPSPRLDADILQINYIPENLDLSRLKLPWVTTYAAPRYNDERDDEKDRNVIFVSEAHARSFGRTRFVYSAIDPDQYHYSEEKEDYLLFMVKGLERAGEKGFDIVVSLKKKLGFRLVVAGSSPDKDYQESFARECRRNDIEFIGEINGEYKADVIAKARALLFPTQLNEPFGTVGVEALVSGTPVIASDKGVCPEIYGGDTGYICSDMADYVRAVENIDRISHRRCREEVLQKFHYLRMTRDYVREYEREIEYVNALTDGPAVPDRTGT